MRISQVGRGEPRGTSSQKVQRPTFWPRWHLLMNVEVVERCKGCVVPETFHEVDNALASENGQGFGKVKQPTPAATSVRKATC